MSRLRRVEWRLKQEPLIGGSTLFGLDINCDSRLVLHQCSECCSRAVHVEKEDLYDMSIVSMHSV